MNFQKLKKFFSMNLRHNKNWKLTNQQEKVFRSPRDKLRNSLIKFDRSLSIQGYDRL